MTIALEISSSVSPYHLYSVNGVIASEFLKRIYHFSKKAMPLNIITYVPTIRKVHFI